MMEKHRSTAGKETKPKLLQKLKAASERRKMEPFLKQLPEIVDRAIAAAPREVFIDGRISKRSQSEAEKHQEMFALYPDYAVREYHSTPPLPSEIVTSNKEKYKAIVRAAVARTVEINATNGNIDEITKSILNHEFAHSDVAAEDPRLHIAYAIRFSRNAESGELMITGSTKLHGTTTVGHLRKIFGAPKDDAIGDNTALGNHHPHTHE